MGCIAQYDKRWASIYSTSDMYDMCYEKAMKGGGSYISKRHRKSSDKYLKSNNPKKESKHII